MQVNVTWRNGMRRRSVIYALQHIGMLLCNEMKGNIIGGSSSMIGKMTKVTD